MKSNGSTTHWQDWAVFGMRWMLLLVVILAEYIIRSRTAPFSDYNLFLIPAGVVAFANILLAILIFIPPAQPALPFIIAPGDWAIAAALTSLVGVQPLLLVLILVALCGIGLLRFGWMWGTLHVLGVFAAVGATLLIRVPNFNTQLEREVPTFIIALGGAIIVGMWAYFRDEHTHGQERRLKDITRQKEAELNDMRDRTRAISEMATTLNGTLNYEKILDAALDIGRLSIRKENKNRVISIVFLYGAQNGSLYIANSRGLSHNDLHRTVEGQNGILGKSLDKCIPIIGKDLSKDPELNSFVALQGMRSSLAIPLRAGYDNYGAVLYASDSSNAFDEDRIDALMAISTQATVALQNAVLHRSLMEEKERIIEMEENARKALVRDLHDVPTQTVSAVAMRLRIIQKLHERGSDEVPSELKTVEDMALRATEELRHVLFKLRPLALESQGLSAALTQLAEKMGKTYKQNVVAQVGPDVETALDQNAQGVIFYLVEEAVNNARKYAEASMINVKVGRKGSVILVRIADNGKGFEMGSIAGNDKSYGMTNMRERAELLDGTLKVESAPGIGTTITATIPIPEKSVSVNGNSLYAEPKQTRLAVASSSRTNGQ
jgi:signal transduction histidine kinase